MKTILVTGSNGFIGKALCSALCKQGHIVVGLSKTGNGTGTIKADLLDLEDCRTRLAGLKPDVVVHLAALTSKRQVPLGQNMLSINIRMMQTILDLFEKFDPLFLFASSIAVYGEACRGQVIRLDEPLKPSTEYGKSKLECESMLKESNLTDFRILRFTPVYAPDDLNDIAKRVFVPGQRKLRMRMIPSPAYNFCSIDSAAEALIKAIEQDHRCRSISHVMDDKHYSQADILSWFSGPSIPVFVKPVQAVVQLSRMIPGSLGYSIQCNIEKLFRTHLFSPEVKVID
jgi:UDP-glucose 4-epimerase